jgi:pimeloyl-ACP methyl ester carboxylesterase
MTSGEAGPSIVLLHGGTLGSSATAAWRFTAPFLGAHGFRVYCPDMPGFGLSDMSEEHWPTGPASHVDFLQELTTALCLDRFHLAGNSLGCFNTVNYAVAHPERVTSFALISGPIGDLVPLSEQERTAPSPEIPAFDGNQDSMRRALEQLMSNRDVLTDDLVAMACRLGARTQAPHAAWANAAFRFALQREPLDPNLAAQLQTKGRLDALTMPAIYAWGVDDARNPVARAAAQEDALPNVQFFYINGAGHEVQTDAAASLNQLLIEFFGRGKVSWETARRAGVSSRRPLNPRLVDVSNENAHADVADPIGAS